MKTEEKRILIVEDQKWPLKALESAVQNVSGNNYETVRSYNDARKMINTNEYDVILLDHRLPREVLGDLEDTDFDRFCDLVEEIGYSLIPEIKERNPRTVVIGTSSSSKEKVRGLPSPDYTMRKGFDYAHEDLASIFENIDGGNR